MDFTFRSIQRPLIRPCGTPSPHWGEGYVIWANANQHTFLEKGDDLKTRFASLLEKERFLESKEKGAPVGVEWSQIGIRRPVFTPPLWTSPVCGRLPRWNRDKPWFYPHFFRRLRGWVSPRGGADWHCRCCGAGGENGVVGRSLTFPVPGGRWRREPPDEGASLRRICVSFYLARSHPPLRGTFSPEGRRYCLYGAPAKAQRKRVHWGERRLSMLRRRSPLPRRCGCSRGRSPGGCRARRRSPRGGAPGRS